MVRPSSFPAFVAILLHQLRGGATQYDGCANGTIADIGDGRCNAENNNPFCGFDGGDCCSCTCSDGALYSCSESDFDCVYPTTCGRTSSATSDTTDSSACVEEFHGDGECDWSENTAACSYDGGDCCICDYSGFASSEDNQFNCLDDAAGNELYDCESPPPPALPCSEEAQQRWVVEDPAQAQALAAAVNCSGGSFEVEWRGSVVVSQSIYVVDGTVLAVTGATSGAVIDGNASTRLFTVVNASLHLTNLSISAGTSIAGGAVAAAGSTLIFSRTNFEGNRAGSHGGAVYVTDRSSVSCVGGGTFADNEAAFDGGAVFVTRGSVVSCGAVWLNNTATRNGGAIMVSDISHVSWNDDAKFSNNTAGYRGGGVAVDSGSSLSWNAPVIFSSNRAEDCGGAVVVLSTSSASWSGITTYVDNEARAGGALGVLEGSSTRWNVQTNFTKNKANFGGAVHADGSNLSWNGEDTEFYENRATSYGGGMNIENSTVSCTNTTFVSNSVVGSGGALQIEDGSSVVFSGNTVFDGNRAETDPVLPVSGYGGCLTLESGEVSWSGDMQFVNNSAVAVGGVFYVSESKVSWAEGKTKFNGNSAQSGGAIFIWNGSAITWTGDTEFTENQADVDGGAIASPSFDSTYNSLDSTLVINGTTMFASNTCGGNGGALAMVEGLRLEFGTAVDISFFENRATIAGGAVYIFGTGVGPKFTNIIFVSNSAQVGGAVSSVGSGGKKGFADRESVNPTTFHKCRFIDNRANATGGAIESAAGQDELVSCLFEGNSAVAGGALRLAGTASLENCSFVDNVSSDRGGPALSNIGSIMKITNTHFSNNGFNCEASTYLEFNEGNPYELVCSGCGTECDECSYDERDSVPACKAVMDNSKSDGGDTLATLVIAAGYWRATTSSVDVLPCYHEAACLGGVTESVGYCEEGYKGPYCSVCIDDYTQEPGFACRKCSGSTSGIVVMTVAGVVALCLGAAVVLYVMSAENEGRRRGPVGRLLRSIPLQSVKIVVAAWQILTQFIAVANVTYPDTYQSFLDRLDVVNFDLGWILSAGCVVDHNFHHRLIISTIGPIVALLFLVGTYTVAANIHRGVPDALQIIWNKHVSMVLLLTFLVYSSVSATLFSTFACDNVDKKTRYLRADYSIKCDSPTHKAFQVYAGFMIVLYTIGIPAFYGALLFKDREVLTKDVAHRADNPRVMVFSGLWKPYKPSTFYYEVVECGRRLLLAGIVVFIYPNSAAQIAITLMMAFAFALLSEGLAPYASSWDSWLNRIGHGVVFMSMYFALLLKVDVSKERADSRKVFQGVLIGAHAFMVLVIVFETVILTCSLKPEQHPVSSLQPLRRLRWKKEVADDGKDDRHSRKC